MVTTAAGVVPSRDPTECYLRPAGLKGLVATRDIRLVLGSQTGSHYKPSAHIIGNSLFRESVTPFPDARSARVWKSGCGFVQRSTEFCGKAGLVSERFDSTSK